MKKISRFLFFLFFAVQACSIKKETQTLKLTVDAVGAYPVKIFFSNLFLSQGDFSLADTTDVNAIYTFVPGQMLSVNDTTFYVFYSDTIIVNSISKKLAFHSYNALNTKYNRVLKDLQDTLAPLYQNDLFFFQNKEYAILKDSMYIENYLSENDSLISESIEVVLNRYQLSQKERFEIRNSVLEIGKLSRSFFYLSNCISRLDSIGKLQERLRYYISEIDKLHVSVFSQNEISLLVNRIAYYLIKTPISRIKTQDDLENYYLNIQHFFKKKSTSYNFLIAAITAKAQSNGIKFNKPILMSLEQEMRQSILFRYIPSNHNNQQIKTREDNYHHDDELYDMQLKSINLTKTISIYNRRPLLIDFWASWCAPCIKSIPEIIKYKKDYTELNIVFVSLDKSHDAWKSFLYEKRELLEFPQYRRNYLHQDGLFDNISEIPKYGLLYGDEHIEFIKELSDSVIVEYLKKIQ